MMTNDDDDEWWWMIIVMMVLDGEHNGDGDDNIYAHDDAGIMIAMTIWWCVLDTNTC